LLVLTRHVHQSIVIGHDVVVTVLEVRGDQVRLGITAPKDVQVHREEVFAALTAANRQAATSASELEVLNELSGEPARPPGEAGGGAPAARSGPAAERPDRSAAAGDRASPSGGTGDIAHSGERHQPRPRSGPSGGPAASTPAQARPAPHQPPAPGAPSATPR
jgi:carbon storage regulator